MSDLSFINCPDAITILKNKKNNVAFIDVRKRKTYVQQFAFGAINCPVNRFHFIIQDLVPDPSTYLLIIGASKNERIKTSSILKKKRFSNFHYIRDGYKAWSKAKLPMWAGEHTFCKAFGEWIEVSGNINNIYPKQLKELHQKDMSSVAQIDARPKAEYEKFTLPFSKQCSGGELPVYLNDKKYNFQTFVVHCAGRTRSIIAYQTLTDFNFSNKKYVLNGGTQNWELNGFQRDYKQKSKIHQKKIDLTRDKKLASKIQKKFQLPSVNQARSIQNCYSFIIESEIKKNTTPPVWKKVNATTLIQSGDKFIAATNTPIYIFSEIATSAIFTVLWLRRLGYPAIWHKNPPRKNLTRTFNKKDFNDPTYFFPKRHKGNKQDAKGYLNWEHQLIPTFTKWGCPNPWISIRSKQLKKVTHPLSKVYAKTILKKN